MKLGLRNLVLVLLAFTVTACASAGAAGEDTTRRDARRITAEEIAEASQTDAYDLVRTLRPAWLRKRGGGSASTLSAGATADTDIAVVMDNVQMGGPEALRQIPLSAIRWMEFVDAMTATQRWGTGYPYGAIVVHTR